MKTRSIFFSVSAMCLLTAQQASAQQLPDWSGVWELVGGTLWDRSTAEPADGRAGVPGVREHPPYNAEWEAKYEANIARVREDHFPDPISTCGIPVGFPRVMNATIRTSPVAASCATAVMRPAESNFGRNAVPCSRASSMSEMATILFTYAGKRGARPNFVAR